MPEGSALPTWRSGAVNRIARSWRPVTLALFAGWVLLVGSHHEPWFDEAQSWLLVRDTDPWTLVAERLRYEGSPGLWHLVLWCAMRAGLPFSRIFLLPAAFAVAGAAVVLWRAPFPAPLRMAVLASYFFGYQYSVIARSYCIDLLLIPLAASFFAQRLERPLRYALVIGLIANVNAQGFVAAGVLGLELTWRVWSAGRFGHGRSLAALLLAAALGLFAMWTTWQPADNGFLEGNPRPGFLLVGAVYLSNAFIYRIAVWNSQPQGNWVFLALLVTILLQWPIARLVMAGRNRLMFLGVFGAIIGFAVVVYADRWGSGILLLFWLFLLWVEWGNPISGALRCEVMAACSILCLMQGVETLRSGLWDIGQIYSPGQQAAAALVAYRHDHPSARVAAYGLRAFEVQPWLGGNPFSNYHGGARNASYVLWDKHEPWPVKTSLTRWQLLLVTKPDLIVASRVDFTPKQEQLGPLACRMGYGLGQIFPGSTIWHGVVVLDDTLYFFERGSTTQCR